MTGSVDAVGGGVVGGSVDVVGTVAVEIGATMGGACASGTPGALAASAGAESDVAATGGSAAEG